MNGALGGGEEKKLPGAGSDPSNSGGIPMNLVAFQTPYGKMGLAEENGALVHLYLPNEGMPRIAEHEDEATVKTLRRKDGHTWLMPENPDYEPIDGTYAEIIGKVVAVVRKY